jgi:hypothetical protein
VKRQPLFTVRQPLTIDDRIPAGSKNPLYGKTWKQAMETDEGKSFISWVATNFREEEIRKFAAGLLVGDVTPVHPGATFNPFWFEHGAMKAARNARFRLIPAIVRARVMKAAKDAGKVRTVDKTAGPQAQAAKPTQPPTEKQLTLLRELVKSHAFSAEQRKEILAWAEGTVSREQVSKAIDQAQDRIAKWKDRGSQEQDQTAGA